MKTPDFNPASHDRSTRPPACRRKRNGMMPMSRNSPSSEIRLNSPPSSWMVSSAPTPADGSVERIVSGWMKLS